MVKEVVESLTKSLNPSHLQDCSVSLTSWVLLLFCVDRAKHKYSPKLKHLPLTVGEGQSSQVQSYKCVSGCVFVLYDASQAPGARWDLPHWVGWAPLTSLSSLDKDGRNLPLCFSLLSLLLLPPFFLPPSVSLLHHLSLLSFSTFPSTWIYFRPRGSSPFALSLSPFFRPLPPVVSPPVDWLV